MPQEKVWIHLFSHFHKMESVTRLQIEDKSVCIYFALMNKWMAWNYRIIYFLSSNRWQVRKTELLSFGKATILRGWKLCIQTRFTPLDLVSLLATEREMGHLIDCVIYKAPVR